jgi:hypothetical protein
VGRGERRENPPTRDAIAKSIGDLLSPKKVLFGSSQSRSRELVASESVTILFPSGAWEYAVTALVLDAGDTLLREGTTWVVAAVTESVDDHRVITMALPAEAQK